MENIEKYSDVVEQALSALSYPLQPTGLYNPIKYSHEAGGKRLRPVLLLATAHALGAKSLPVSQALGIEMFHNFTLLHDDVMDNADVRRGRPTVHRRWDANTAILSGDAMLTMASQLMADECPAEMLPAVLHWFNKTAMEVYEGQQYDMDFEERQDVSVAEYIEMIRLKTSVLLAAACHIGALMAKASETVVDAMTAYAEALGLAFQLQDDYLDTYGDPTLFGKEIGGDIINEKKTWLWITAMAERPEEMRRVLDKHLTDYLKIEQIKEIYDAIDLPARSAALRDEYVQKAIRALDNADLNEQARTFFVDLAMGASSRSH